MNIAVNNSTPFERQTWLPFLSDTAPDVPAKNLCVRKHQHPPHPTTMNIMLPGWIRTALLSTVLAIAHPALPQSTALTYQGRLDNGGVPANGPHDLRYTLYDAPTGGSAVGGALTNLATAVSNGLFTVTLDFGPGVFTGNDRWLEIAARLTDETGFTVLAPRQPVTATPHALVARAVTGPVAASQLTGTLPGPVLAGAYGAVLMFTNPANAFHGSFAGNGSGLTNLNATELKSGTVPDARLAGNVARTNQVWLLGGNAGTLPALHYLGTSDDVPLELRVNGRRTVRLTSGGTNKAPNLIAGASVNTVAPGVFGATISGGGAEDWGGLGVLSYTNRVSGNFGTVAGGRQNEAAGPHATVSGGAENLARVEGATVSGGSLNVAGAPGGGTYATVGGGLNNQATGERATVAGGGNNVANGDLATVSGGLENQASGYTASVPGGRFNRAAGDYSLAAGIRAKADHEGAFVWADASSSDEVLSTAANQVTFRASGGFRIFTDATLTNGVRLAHGGGSWISISDRHAKENFAPADADAVLERVVALPVQTWNYRTQSPDIRHIGPTAQDFHAAFGVGESDTGITGVDADGVALAAIQGLNRKLERENAALKARLEKLEQLLQQRLSQGQP